MMTTVYQDVVVVERASRIGERSSQVQGTSLLDVTRGHGEVREEEKRTGEAEKNRV